MKPNCVMQRQSMKRVFWAFVPLLLIGCGTLKNEQVHTNVCPRVPNPSEEILQTMQPDSTEVLKKADSWLENSKQLLDSVTGN